MPQWILLSLLAGISGSISNILYRTTLKGEQDALISAWILQLLRVCIASLILVWIGILLDIRSIIILLILGCLDLLGMYCYMRMHAMSSLSISAIIQRSRILWVSLFAAAFIGETFTSLEVIGLLVLFIGVSFVSAPHKLRLDKGMQFAYFSAILFSITTVMIKATIGSIPPAAQVAGLAFPTVVIFPFLTSNFIVRLRLFTGEHFFLKVFAALTNVVQVFLSVYSLVSGTASKSSAIYQGTLVLSVFAGIILLGEREDVPRKVWGSVLVLSGIVAIGWA